MPTTRSRKRPSEVLTSLPDPTRKPRKKRILEIPMNLSISPEPPEEQNVTGDNRPRMLDTMDTHSSSKRSSTALPSPLPKLAYADSCTQTEGRIYMLTHTDLDAMIEDAVERKITSNKRMRDEEDESRPPSSKRINLTPSANNGYGFLFNKPPNTAPAKSFFAAPTPGRVIRGPISSRNITPMNRHRRAPRHSTASRRSPAKQQPSRLKPVVLEPSRPDLIDADHDENEVEQEEELSASPVSSQPARRSLFGSLRGLAQSGFDFAMGLSPRRQQHSNAQTQTPSHHTNTSSPPSDALDSVENGLEVEEVRGEAESGVPSTSPNNHQHSPTATPRQSTERRSSRYDHLHHIRPGSEEERRLAAGQRVSPPRPATPLDEFEAAKVRNPGVPDATLRTLLARRAKRKALIGESSLIKSAPPKVAPLFGPDSHYARGTVDPRFVSAKSYQMYAKYPNLTGGSVGTKRTFDAYDSDHEPKNQYLQPSVEDGDDDAQVIIDDLEEDTSIPDTPLAKKQKTTYPTTPRSALKRQHEFSDSVGRSGRSVNFKANPVSGSRDLRAHYGPAGQYKGSTFADLSSPTSNDSPSMSTLDHEDVISPATKTNTIANSLQAKIDAMVALEKNIGAKVPDIDFTLRDPDDPNWRPSLTNPRPGSFRVPYTDDESDEEEEATTTGTVPPQPSTPRLSHAELPSSAASQITNSASFNESSIQFESTELAIEKARSRAQKYKPKDSSRLSEVSLSHSRSPSPEAEDTPRLNTATAPAVQPVGTPAQSWKQRKPYTERSLDNVTRGGDGMTDYEREHQYDDWAASLPWGSVQTYEEAGTGTKEIHDLIRKNWNEDDSRRSEEFWQKEFDEIDLLQKKAMARNQMLQFITGMEDADQYVG